MKKYRHTQKKKKKTRAWTKYRLLLLEFVCVLFTCTHNSSVQEAHEATVICRNNSEETVSRCPVTYHSRDDKGCLATDKYGQRNGLWFTWQSRLSSRSTFGSLIQYFVLTMWLIMSSSKSRLYWSMSVGMIMHERMNAWWRNWYCKSTCDRGKRSHFGHLVCFCGLKAKILSTQSVAHQFLLSDWAYLASGAELRKHTCTRAHTRAHTGKTCGLDTIGMLIKELQTMGREISRGGGLGHWRSATILFSCAALCFLSPLAFPKPGHCNLCVWLHWVS